MPNLILSRREGEAVVLNDNITITFIGFSGRNIRIAIEAPSNVRIRRGELSPKPDSPPPMAHDVSAPAEAVGKPKITIRQRKRKSIP